VRRIPLILLSVAALSANVLAQGRPVESREWPPQQPQQPGTQRPEPRREVPEDPAEATRLLNRTLQDLDERRERVREAIQKIQQGTPVREALRGVDLRPERGPRPEHGPGGPGGPNGEPRIRMGGDPGGLAEALGDRSTGRRLEHPPTPEQKAHAMAFMREHLPDIATRMQEYEKTEPERAERALMRIIPRVLEAEGVRKSDPKLFMLRVREIDGQAKVVEAIRVDREARESKDPARIEQATAELRAALSTQFDTRLELQEHEIESLTRRLEELKNDVQKKRSTRNGAIDEMAKRVREFGERRARERSESRPKDGDKPAPDATTAPKR